MITTAVDRGGYVYVYDGNKQIFSRPGQLHGYTSSTVSIKRDKYVYTYNDKGAQVSSQYSN